MYKAKFIFLLALPFIRASCSLWKQAFQSPPEKPATQPKPISFTPIVLGDTICQFTLQPDRPKLAMVVPIDLPTPPKGFRWKIQLMTALNARNDTTITCLFADPSLQSLKIDQPAPLTDPNNPGGSKTTTDSFTQSAPAEIKTEAQLELSTRFVDAHFRQRISLIAIPVPIL